MTISISFYNNVKYTKDDFMGRDKDFFGNGVVNLTDFPLTYNSNMMVSVGAGTAWVDGYRIHNDSTVVTLTVPAADSTNPRIDIVQIGHDDVNSTYSLMVKQGVAAASPVEPGADANYIKLYAINVAANATQITSANVVDKRSLVPLNVSSSQISSGGSVTNTDPAYLAVKNGTYILAGDGITTTAGSNMETVAVKPATATTLGGVIAGTGVSIDGTGKISVTPYTLPSDVAKYDAAQTWSAAQTFAQNLLIWNGGANGIASGTAPYIFMKNYSTQAGGQATFLSNWSGSNYWGIGGVDSTSVKIGVADSGGLWVSGQSFTLKIDGGIDITGNYTKNGQALSTYNPLTNPRARLV